MQWLISVVGLGCLILGSSSPAMACEVAEQQRLSEEQQKLAGRNAWTGVERAYESLLDLRCPLTFETHFLGAESARYLGKTWEQHERLKLALQIDPQPELIDSLGAIDAAYGRVDIRGDARRRPVLVREQMPFAPDQRKGIEWAQTVVDQTGSFYGMLPAGEYVVGDIAFTVEVGPDFDVLTVDRGRGAAPTNTTASAGLLRYANIVATIGPSLLATPETQATPTLADGGHQFAPANVAASGFMAQVGGELGVTYDEPALGVAATLGYTGGYGTDTLHGVSAWVAGVVRPGRVRIAVGPMYQAVIGSGTGVATWFDRGQDPISDPNEEVLYSGVAWGPGAQGAIGYGLLDFDKLQGVVEVGGSWQSDGARSYYGIGLRVGIVPTVPRFEG